MPTPRGWLLVSPRSSSGADFQLNPRSTTTIFNQISKVGPIVAGVLGGISLILLLLLGLRIHRNYNIRRRRALGYNKSSTPLFRCCGKRRRRPPVPAPPDEFLWEREKKQLDVEAFPYSSTGSERSVSVLDRPLPGVPAITRTPSHDEIRPQTPASGNHARTLSAASRTKTRVRPDPMLINDMLAVEERRRQDFAGFTPARRFYFDVPPPMPGRRMTDPAAPPAVESQPPPMPVLPIADPVFPPGLATVGQSESRLEGSAPIRTSSVRGPRLRSRSEPRVDPLICPPRRSSSERIAPLDPTHQGDVSPEQEPLDRRQLRQSLREAQDAVELLEDYLSISTIDIPPLTGHSRHFLPPNSREDLQTEVTILRREVQRLQNLLLANRRNDIGEPTPASTSEDDPHPPPTYTS